MRYLIVGTSGAGKSTLAKKLATATRSPYIEMDAHYWGPGWHAVPPEQFKRSIVDATQGECWVADGNYSAVRGVLWSRATHVVWLNYGRFTVFSRLLWRTAQQRINAHPPVSRQPGVAAHGVAFKGLDTALVVIHVFDEPLKVRSPARP